MKYCGIHDALLELESIDGILVRVVEMRYFAGLSEEEIAEAMQISTRTVRRHCGHSPPTRGRLTYAMEVRRS